MGESWTCRCQFGIHSAGLWTLSGLSLASFWPLSGLSLASLWPLSGLSLALLTNMSSEERVPTLLSFPLWALTFSHCSYGSAMGNAVARLLSASCTRWSGSSHMLTVFHRLEVEVVLLRRLTIRLLLLTVGQKSQLGVLHWIWLKMF